MTRGHQCISGCRRIGRIYLVTIGDSARGKEVWVIRRLTKAVKNQGGSKRRKGKGTSSGRIKEKNTS